MMEVWFAVEGQRLTDGDKLEMVWLFDLCGVAGGLGEDTSHTRYDATVAFLGDMFNDTTWTRTTEQ